MKPLITKPRFHIDEKHIPYTDQPEAIQSPTHTLGDNGELVPIKKGLFEPSDMVPMDWGANYSSI